MKKETIYLAAAIVVLVTFVLGIDVFVKTVQGKNTLGLAMLVYYEDGTTQEYDPTAKPLSLFYNRLSIVDVSGRTVLKTDVKVKSNQDWTGTVSDWNMDGKGYIYIDGVKVASFTFIQKPSLSSITKGSYMDVFTKTIMATDFDGWSIADGSHTLKVTSDVTLKMTFKETGTESTKTASSSLEWKFNKVAAAAAPKITTFEITAYVSPYT